MTVSVSGTGAPERMSSRTRVSACANAPDRLRSVMSLRLPTMPAHRRFVQLVGPGRLDPPPVLAVEHVELGVERLVGMRLQRFVERVALVDARRRSRYSREAAADEVVRRTPEDVVDRRTDVLHAAGLADHHDDVGGVLHERAEPRLALGEDDACLVRLVDQTGDAPRHPEGGDAGDHREHHRRARTGIVEDDDRGRREQRGPEHDHSGASVAHQAGIAGFPERAHRRVHHRRREQEVRDRPQRVERAAVGVGAVGHQPGVDHVGHQHRRRARRRGATPPASSAAA